jgi:hypothetical protein
MSNQHQPYCCRHQRPASSSSSASGPRSALWSIIGGVAALIFIVWTICVIWPFIVVAVVLIGLGAVAKSSKQGG